MPLLVAGICADHVHLALAADDLTVLADPLDTRSHFHGSSLQSLRMREFRPLRWWAGRRRPAVFLTLEASHTEAEAEFSQFTGNAVITQEGTIPLRANSWLAGRSSDRNPGGRHAEAVRKDLNGTSGYAGESRSVLQVSQDTRAFGGHGDGMLEVRSAGDLWSRRSTHR